MLILKCRIQNPNERVHDSGIEMLSTIVLQMLKDHWQRQGFSIWAIVAQGIENVNNGEHPCRDRDILRFQATRVPCSIPFFMMAVGDLQRYLKVIDLLQHVVGILWMPLNNISLLFCQWTILMKDRIRSAHLANVVEQSTSANIYQILSLHAHRFSQPHGEFR